MSTTHPEQPAGMPLAAAARVPFDEPNRRWLVSLPLLAIVLDLVGGHLPYALLAALTVAFVIGSWTITLKMAARCLLAAARGARTRAERAAQDIPPGLVGRLIALWLFALVPASALLTGASRGLLPLLVALVVFLALTPATLMLARSVSLVDALDPLHWRNLVDEIGLRRCGGLAMALLALAVAYIVMAAVPLPDRLSWLGKAVILFYWIWSTVAWFELAGRVMRGQSARVEAAEREHETIDALFERLLREGGTRHEHRRLADALVIAGDTPRLREHGRIHVSALLDGFDDPRAAVEEAATLLDLDPLFGLADTESMYRLVRAARRHGYPALTVRLCGNYLDRFPRSFKCDEVRLIACEAAADGGRDERRVTAGWLAELIAAGLAPDQRVRLKRIVPVFHADGLIRRP